MASKHPKVTAYIPEILLQALDEWREIYDIKSRSEAIVEILDDYLAVDYPVQQQGAVPSRTKLNLVLSEFNELEERITLLEEHINQTISTAPIEAPSTVLTSPAESSISDVPDEALNTAPLEAVDQVSDVIGTAPSTVPKLPAPQPPVPLTQSALAKRLGCSDKAIEKHRKQGSKESFAEWSRTRDPDNVAWTWEGIGGRGQPLRFLPQD